MDGGSKNWHAKWGSWGWIHTSYAFIHSLPISSLSLSLYSTLALYLACDFATFLALRTEHNRPNRFIRLMNFRFKASSAETTIIYGRKIYRVYSLHEILSWCGMGGGSGRAPSELSMLSENILQFKMSKFDSELSFIVSIGNVLSVATCKVKTHDRHNVCASKWMLASSIRVQCTPYSFTVLVSACECVWVRASVPIWLGCVSLWIVHGVSHALPYGVW